MATTMTRHRPVVRRSVDAEQGAFVYQVRCSCGVAGQERPTKRVACQERDVHLREVAPPVEERCARPREHGCRTWDPCQICAHQETLFDL